MDPITIALIGMGLGGSILGSKGRKPIDPNTLRRLFGPDALAGDTRSLYALLASSPEFMAIMNSASNQGAMAGQRVRAGLGRAGIGDSGIGAISSALSRDYGRTMQLNAQGGLWQRALAEAAQNLQGRMGLYGQSQLKFQDTPTMAQQIGAAMTGGASMGLSTKMAPRTPAAAAPSGGSRLDMASYNPDWKPWEAPRPVVGSGGTIIRSRPF